MLSALVNGVRLGKKVASDEVLVSNMGENFQVWAAIVPQSPVGVCYPIEQKKTGWAPAF